MADISQTTFQTYFLKWKVWISINISLKFVAKGPISKIPALFQIMAWRRPGDKPLSEAMLVSLLTHKCVTRPQWVNWSDHFARESARSDISGFRLSYSSLQRIAVSVNFAKTCASCENFYDLLLFNLRIWRDISSNFQICFVSLIYEIWF